VQAASLDSSPANTPRTANVGCWLCPSHLAVIQLALPLCTLHVFSAFCAQPITCILRDSCVSCLSICVSWLQMASPCALPCCGWICGQLTKPPKCWPQVTYLSRLQKGLTWTGKDSKRCLEAPIHCHVAHSSMGLSDCLAAVAARTHIRACTRLLHAACDQHRQQGIPRCPETC
jgi:hypothetical protein